jgi:hypothetical protein
MKYPKLRNIMLLEIMINMVMPIPGLDSKFEFQQLGATLTYSIDTIIVSVMLIKCYHIFRLFGDFTSWNGPKAVRFCNYVSTTATTMFALKASNKAKPYHLIAIWMSFTAIFFGIYIRLFERDDPDGPFEQTHNGPWLAILTMTTIGYGEIFPRTHLGRLMATISCVLGVFLFSLFVVALYNTTNFNRFDTEAYEDLALEKEKDGHLGVEALILI